MKKTYTLEGEGDAFSKKALDNSDNDDCDGHWDKPA
jgi:hypothetical protein